MSTITTEFTRDELAHPDHRSIRTTWATSIKTFDNYDGENTILLVLETAYHKNRKILISSLYTEIQKDGYSVREFTLRESSGGSGITIDTEPVARFNAKIARDLHSVSLAMLEASPITREDRAGIELAAAWAARI